MKNKGQKNERTTRVRSLILLVAFTAIMLIVSTYAWFSTQRAVSISNITGEVKVAEGLEISLDAKNWSENIVLAENTLTTVSTADTVGTYSTTANRKPSELKPASTIGAAGNTTVKMYSGTFDGTWLNDITLCDETDSKAVSSDNDFAGYYAFDVFLRNSSQAETPQGLKLSAGSYASVLASGGVDTTGLQNTVRVAFAEYEGTAEVNANQAAILDATVGAIPADKTGEANRARTVETSQVAIWEPNANFHVLYMKSNSSRFGSVIKSRNQVLTTKAVNDVATPVKLNVYNAEEDGYKARLTQQKAIQTSITVPENDVDENDAELMPESYATTAATILKDTTADAATFAIKGNAVSRLRVYVWLEGQDADCVNYASHGGGVELKIGLEKE